MKQNPYQLLIFDWDGTLMDSAAKIVACLRAAIAHAGLPARTDAALRHIIGLGIYQAFEYLFPEGVTAAQHETLVQEYKRQFLELNVTPAAMFANVEPFLHDLRAQGYYLAIATGKSRLGLNRVLDDVALAPLFHASRCADETQSKPHPQMLHELLEAFNVPASAALMIGDTEFDIEMAKAANMHAVAVAWGAHDPSHLEKFAPLTILEDVTHLLSWLTQRELQVSKASA
ncbi:MAG: HAD-IA family hydrolase [Gammaproteobacteria bacterium]|nr:HAD-IA family hydrolase [Gammaproteobacteria bacterium]